MPESIAQALEVLGTVLIYAVSWFVGFTSIMAVPTVWRKLKKMTDKEKKAHEEIIVKRAEKITELDKERSSVADEIITIKDELVKLKEEKALLKKAIKDEEKALKAEKADDESETPADTPAPTRGKAKTGNKKAPKKAPA